MDLETGLRQDGHQAPRHAVVILNDGDPHICGFYVPDRHKGQFLNSWDFSDIGRIPWDSSDTIRALASRNWGRALTDECADAAEEAAT
ncbi:hypothetical protein Aph01nite_16280 [Acrocarpospora phusangensis]|uniref:Uncharacterized protein n=1 Tax=Acrocarpospora phusangensis TaxID=1070424 RepID=A0A919Q7D4_9ACTN|nr:hypothetical protein Aph01nite_16280 [Acrocarpospora phusangensis]